MLAKFNREHWHDEDEVRFIIEGRGIFHIHSSEGGVTAIEVEAGDLIRVPRGTHHWFNLCSDRRIRAIRLFQDPAAGRRTTLPVKWTLTISPFALAAHTSRAKLHKPESDEL